MVNDPLHPEPTDARWLSTGAEGYRLMLAAIEQASKSVRLETYIFRAAGPGERFRAALIRAARRGVRVQVLLDGYGSYDLPEHYWRELTGAGGAVRIFNPFSFRLFSIRNHRKLLLVDDAAAWVGGFNIGPEYDGDGVAHGWRDFGLELHQRPALRDLAETFDALFRNHHLHGRPLQRFRRRSLARRRRELHPIVLLSGPRWARNEFRAGLMRALSQARRVQLVSGYFLPSLRLRWALRQVVRRGGTVELLLPGKTDVPLAQAAGRSLYGSLLRAGVRIWEYQPQVLHGKLAIIDDVVFAGSSNLDARSFGINYELMVRIDDARLAERGRALFAAARQAAVERLQPEWRRGQDWRTRLAGFWARFVLTKVDPWIARRQLRTIS